MSSTREKILKAIEKMKEEDLEGVLDYIYLIQEPEEVEPTKEELEAIKRGQEEYARGDYVKWEDLKRKA